MRLDYQILLESTPLNLLAGSAPGWQYLHTACWTMVQLVRDFTKLRTLPLIKLYHY